MFQVLRRKTAAVTIAAAATLALSTFTAVAASASTGAASPHPVSAKLAPFMTFEYGKYVTHGRITQGSITVVARFHLPGHPNGPAGSIPADNSSYCADDGGYTFQTCLTQNFLVCTVGSARLINLQSYVERWTMIDPSGTYQLEGPAGMRAGVNGPTNPAKCGGSGGWYINNAEKSINPAPFTNYTFKPSWVGHYTEVNNTALFQCGDSYVQIYNYIHPAQTWTLLNPDVCQGEVGTFPF